MDERKKYNVTEFAKLCGVTPRTLKYYEEIGLFRPDSVGDNGYRLYSVNQLDEISAIRLFREHGLSLKEIGEMLSGDDVESMLKRLTRQQEILNGKIQKLRQQQYFVEHTLHFVQAAAEHMEEPFWENCEPRRIHCVPHESRIVNYLLQGYGNGAILDGESLELKGTYRAAEDGEILLEGKCLTFYCMGAPLQSREKLAMFRKKAEAEGLSAENIFCEEILERAGGGQGLFRYFYAGVGLVSETGMSSSDTVPAFTITRKAIMDGKKQGGNSWLPVASRQSISAATVLPLKGKKY